MTLFIAFLIFFTTVYAAEGRSSIDSRADMSLLFTAVERGNVTLAKDLFASGVRTNSAKDFGLLQAAIGSHSMEMTQLLIDNDLNLNSKEDNTAGHSLICRAIFSSCDNVEILTGLIENSAKINDDEFASLLLYVFQRDAIRNERVIDFLFANGADINGKYYPNGETLLYQAIWRTKTSTSEMLFSNSLFKYLIYKGADLNTRNDQGYAPLHVAADVGNEVVAQMLLENGAKVDMETNNGNTPFAIAAANIKKGKKMCIIKILIRNGAISDVGITNWLLDGIKAFEGLQKFMEG